jgi:hypothetical protein
MRFPGRLSTSSFELAHLDIAALLCASTHAHMHLRICTLAYVHAQVHLRAYLDYMQHLHTHTLDHKHGTHAQTFY